MTLVSYVIPVYNMEKYIRDCINSIFFQILPKGLEIEIIVVNDGSTDFSMERIEDAFNDRFGSPDFKHIIGYKIHCMILNQEILDIIVRYRQI